MKIGRKSIPGQNPNRRQGQVPTHPADMGHTVQHTLPVSLLWRAEGPAKNVTGNLSLFGFPWEQGPGLESTFRKNLTYRTGLVFIEYGLSAGYWQTLARNVDKANPNGQ